MSMFSTALGWPRRLAMSVMSTFEPSDTTERKVELSNALEPDDDESEEPRIG